MSRTRPTLTVDRATSEEIEALEALRRAAHEPLRALRRARLGDAIYRATQQGADEGQAARLASQVRGEEGWEVLVGRLQGRSVAFLALRLRAAESVGELGLFAVHPGERGHGIGGALLDSALTRMRLEGLTVATVAAAEDPETEALYAQAGFDVSLPGARVAREL